MLKFHPYPIKLMSSGIEVLALKRWLGHVMKVEKFKPKALPLPELFSF